MLPEADYQNVYLLNFQINLKVLQFTNLKSIKLVQNLRTYESVYI